MTRIGYRQNTPTTIYESKDTTMTELIYGLHAVRAAIANPERRVRAIYGTDKGLAQIDAPNAELKDRAALDKMTGGGVHQGVVAVVEPLDEMFLSDVTVTSKPGDVIVMLDQVTDPHNIGAILRSCSAFGAKGLILQKRHAPEITGVLAKTASGAVEHVPVIREVNLSRALHDLQDSGFTAIGLDERGENSIAQIPKADKTVLVLGAEGKGLRQGVAETCDHLARLPTQGPIASLNVSNAAAVALYALTHRQ